MVENQAIAPTQSAPAMDVMEAIRSHRAVHSYTGEVIDEAIVHTLLQAAVHTPISVQQEPLAFAVIQDKAVLKSLSDKSKETMSAGEQALHIPDMHPEAHFTPPDDIFYNAGTLIVIYGKPASPFVDANCWMGAENIMLAATAMSLGTCVIGLAVAALNTPEWKKELKVPVEMKAYVPIIVGMLNKKLPEVDTEEPEIFDWKFPFSSTKKRIIMKKIRDQEKARQREKEFIKNELALEATNGTSLPRNNTLRNRIAHRPRPRFGDTLA